MSHVNEGFFIFIFIIYFLQLIPPWYADWSVFLFLSFPFSSPALSTLWLRFGGLWYNALGIGSSTRTGAFGFLFGCFFVFWGIMYVNDEYGVLFSPPPLPNVSTVIIYPPWYDMIG